MINLGSTYFKLNFPTLNKDELKAYAVKLFEEWELEGQELVLSGNYSLKLEVRTGSLIACGVICAIASAVYTAIVKYPDFSKGMRALIEDVNALRTTFRKKAAAPYKNLNEEPLIRDYSVVLRKVGYLVNELQAGRMSSDHVCDQLKIVFGDDRGEIDVYRDQLKACLDRLPVQGNLDLGDVALPSKRPKERKALNHKRQPKEKEEKYQVSVSRDSSNNEISVRIKKI
ncbi:MAG: hypothetical protein ACI4NJ_00455 [Cellvibrio sp.]